MLKVEAHASRWESFRLYKRQDEAFICKILDDASFPKGFFPSLRHFELVFAKLENSTLRDLERMPKDFIRDWSMPALQSLKLRNYIPSRIQGSPTKLSLKLYDDDGFPFFVDFCRVSSLLDSFRSLTELTVTSKYITHSTCLSFGTPALLSRLKRLTLRLHCTTEEVLSHLLTSFYAPTVRYLNIKASARRDDGVRSLVSLLFPEDRACWPQVTSLNLVAQCYCSGTMAELPSLEYLPPLHIALTRLRRMDELVILSSRSPSNLDPEDTILYIYQA